MTRDLKTIESLLTKDGRINTAIIKQPWFLKTDAYKLLLEKTKVLDMFKKVNISSRIWFYLLKVNVLNCVKCGEPYVIINARNSQCKTYSLCNHNKNQKIDFSKRRKIETINQKRELLKSVLQNKLVLSNDEFTSKFKALLKKISNVPNYAFMISKEFFKFYNDLIFKTKDILPFDLNNEQPDFKLSERFFIYSNNLTELPTCKFCGKPVVFQNRILGYKENCPDCCNNQISETVSKTNKEFIANNVNLNKYEIISIPEICYKAPLVVRCRKCGKTSEVYLINGKMKNLKNENLCSFCEKTTSSFELEIVNFLSGLNLNNISIKRHVRTVIQHAELDIYIPEKKLAIEFDGLYWHSDDKKHKNYHLTKTELCEEQGIQLIHIFENEWRFKQDIVKSRLKNLLGISDKTVYARKCEIHEVDNKTSKKFQDENHIQGSVNSNINIGLFYENELISLMTFGKSRFNKHYEYELLRFCNKLGYHIPGSAGKLLNFFKLSFKPKNIISYADRRWSVGNVYKKLGFVLTGISKPNYWYFKSSNLLESRIKYQKHKLKNILSTFDESLSEQENMKNNGYYVIYDCGNLVFVKEF